MAETVIGIAHVADVSTARQTARILARAVGFDETATEEIAIAVSELAFNLATHAQGGQLTLTPLEDGDRCGLQIEAHDLGPGIADVERALTDGFSTGGTLGYGLGTVNRLLDTCDVTSQPGQGTHVVGQRWLRPATRSDLPCPLEVGIGMRPYPGSEAHGDAFILKQWAGHLLVGVVDGLGHGPLAHQAAETARQFVESHYDRPLDEIFRGVATACRATRGVVMALACFDYGPRQGQDGRGSVPPDARAAIRLSFASIGNVEARVLHAPEPINLMVRRGVLGGTAPAPLVTHHAWDLRSTLVLQSDGLTTRWRWEDFPDIDTQPATRAAQRLLQALAKPDDDATVMVIKGKGSS